MITPRRLGARASFALWLACLAAPSRPVAADAECAPDVGAPATSAVAAASGDLPPSITFGVEADARRGQARIARVLSSLRLTALTATTSGRSLPRRITLHSSDGARVAIDVPAGTKSASAEFAPLAASCVALAWEPASGTITFTVHTDATAEALVRGLAEGGERRLMALRLLPRLGARAIEALESSFDAMTPRERRDALRVYAALASHPLAEARLVAGASSGDPDARRVSADALEGEALLEAARRGSREAAARAAREVPAAAAALALEALETDDAPTLAHARRSLLAAARHLEPGERGTLADALEGLSPLARARALEVLSRLPSVRAALLPALEALLAGAAGHEGPRDRDRFEVAYYAVLAAAAHGGDPGARRETLVSSLAELAGAEEWMLRAEAYRALASLGAAPSVFRAGLEDAYPRVKIAALEAAVATSGVDALESALVAASEDAWPSVRARAVTLAASGGVFLGSPGDRSPRVRGAVLSSWLGSGAREEALLAALAAEESLAVRGEVLEAATVACVRGLDAAARAVLEEAGAADDQAAHAARALRYLLAFEGATRDELVAALRARGVPSGRLEGAPRCADRNAL